MKRPYRTEYFLNADAPLPASYGHSCSEQGSVRGAVVRVFVHQYNHARIVKDGVPLFTIRRSATGIQVRYGRS
jgi:hypothetical protein